MPDEFQPLDWQTGPGSGTPVNEANLDRIEAGIESADDRLDALEAAGAGNAIPATIVNAKGDLIGATAADTVARVPAGTVDGQVLTRSAAASTGMAWAAPSDDVPRSLIDAKGDLIAGTAADTVARLPVGTTGHVLKANSGTATGLEWAADSTSPTGAAGGALNGTYPNPGLDLVPWAPVALTDATAIATDASLGNHFRVTLGGNRTLANPTNPTDGQRALWEVTQDATGSCTLTLGNAFVFGTDITSLTLSTAANKTDYIGAIYRSSVSAWRIVAVSRGY